MAERKTYATKASVRDFLNGIDNETRRKDSKTISKVMAEISGNKAVMWGPSIIGFGKHYYKYADGRDADICKIGFSPRKTSLVFYLANFKGKDALLKKLGKHKTSRSGGGGCLYINKLDDVDLSVLKQIIDKAYKHNLQSC